MRWDDSMSRRVGRLDEAVERFRESLEHSRRHGARWEGAFSMEGLADVAVRCRIGTVAVRLLAAAASIRSQLAAELSPIERQTFDSLLGRTRPLLDADTFANEWEYGNRMTWEEAISESLGLSFDTARMAN